MREKFQKIEEKITIYLSHRPKLYAFIVGVGIVLFWRGVWHTTDLINAYITFFHSNATIDTFNYVWWDGLTSLVIGSIILHFTGAFTSSFIGNELILSGLRGEKRLNQKTEGEVKHEVRAISDIKEELANISQKLDELESTTKK